MKGLIRYAVCLLILLALKLIGLITLSWLWYLYVVILTSLWCLALIAYGFLNERYQARKTREFWRRYNSQTDEFRMYDDEHEND